jgi:hypothetical protein
MKQPWWTHRRLFLALALFTPFWLTIGRAMLGSIGWVTIMLFFLFPLLLTPLIGSLLFYFRADVRASGHLPRKEAIILLVMHLAWFLAGFFLVDVGDTEGSGGSVFSIWLFSNNLELSMMLAALAALVATPLTLWSLARGVVQTFKPWLASRKKPKKDQISES